MCRDLVNLLSSHTTGKNLSRLCNMAIRAVNWTLGGIVYDSRPNEKAQYARGGI